jgi:sialate O-acetylesterase
MPPTRVVVGAGGSPHLLPLLLAPLLALPAARAQQLGVSFPFNVSNTIGNHSVLQRAPQASIVWGFGTQFAPVSIALLDNSSAVAATVSGWVSSLGVWRLTLPPMPAGGPFTLVANSTATKESFVLEDILFGICLLCGGQSNMAFGMSGTTNATAEIAAAAGRPLIRILSPAYSAQNVSQLQFVWEYALTNGWEPATPDNVRYFSAVCYLTAAAAYDALGGTVPFGLIDTSVGGTAIQLWFPPEHWNDCAAVMQPWDVFSPPWTPSCWFNGMVSPLTYGPTQIAGILWDQGENNVGERAMYECSFPMLIHSWREALRAPTAPFVFVQLPAYVRSNDTALAELREGQLFAADTVERVGFACTADDGDGTGDIHNPNKSVVGRRMGAVVRSMLFNESGVPYLAPRYASAAALAPAAGIVTVTVTVSNGPLVWVAPTFESNSTWCPSDAAGRTVYNVSCAWFEIGLSDASWRNASAAVSADGASVVLTVSGVDSALTAVATRNGYADFPVVNVYSVDGLPLVPWGPRNVTAAAAA